MVGGMIDFSNYDKLTKDRIECTIFRLVATWQSLLRGRHLVPLG